MTYISALTKQLAELGSNLKPGVPSTLGVRNEMVAKAKELIDALSSPEQHVLQKGANGMEIFAIRTVMQLGILEALPETGTISLEDLSDKTGAQQSLIERLLRLLVVTRFIAQSADGEYSHTRFSQAYMGTPGDWFAGVLHDHILDSLIQYPAYMDSHPAQRLVEPTSVTHNVFTWRHGMEGETLWTVMATMPEELSRFQKGLHMIGSMNSVTGAYPFDQLAATIDENRPVLVDVGGGAGQCIIDILTAHPTLQPKDMVLQDRPEVIALAHTNPRLPVEVQKVPHDFFTPQPVHGAKAYYMRLIVHDYSDAVAVDILKNVVSAMAPDSKLLIAEAVLPERVSEAALLVTMMDMFMFSLGGKERTIKMFADILQPAGLKIEKVWQVLGSAQALIEAVLL